VGEHHFTAKVNQEANKKKKWKRTALPKQESKTKEREVFARVYMRAPDPKLKQSDKKRERNEKHKKESVAWMNLTSTETLCRNPTLTNGITQS
jgi:hypothetical protein